MFDLTGRKALVTGASGGIGESIARILHAQGAIVGLHGTRVEKLEALASELGDRVKLFPANLSDRDEVKALGQKAEADLEGVDILVNNAGIFRPKPFLEVEAAEYDAFLDTILKGKFFMAQAAARAMRERGGGAIVQTGSLWAIQAIGATPSAAYSAANAGVHALTRNLAIELAPLKIRINTVAPAVVETPVYNTFMSEAQVRETLPDFNAFHPLGRNGQPADVAQAILFLASDQAAWITGTVLPVDGGVTAGRV